MRWIALLLVPACTVNGKAFNPFAGSGGGGSTAPAAAAGQNGWGGAPTTAKVSEAVKVVPRCPNGKKYFLGAPETFPGRGVDSVTLADMNGDGKLDIVTGNPHGKHPPQPHQGNVGVMLGKGDGEFADIKLTPVGGDPSYLLMVDADRLGVADLDGDKKPDLVFSSPGFGGSSPVFALGNGDGSFAENLSLRGGDIGGDAVIADFNADGKKDIAISSYVWLNTSSKKDARFAKYVKFSDGYAEAQGTADFDGDGSPDLVTRDGDKITLFMNDGNGTFTKGTAVQVEDAKAVRVGDFNGDGKPDLAVTAKSLAILMGQGGGKLAAPVYYAAPEDFSLYSLTVTDLNGDGRADVIVPDQYKGIGVYMNDGKGALASPIVIGITKAWMVAAGDLTGDKVQSVVVVDDSESSDEDNSHIYVLHASCR